jgi:hypothetical protein
VKEIYSGSDEDRRECSVVTLGAGHSVEEDSLVWDHHEEIEVEVLGTGSRAGEVHLGAMSQCVLDVDCRCKLFSV